MTADVADPSAPRAYVHLHVHSEYSLLDGSIRIKKLLKEVKSRGGWSVALTDHDSLHGYMEFYLEAQAQGIHPVLGYEANVQGGVTKGSQTFHLVLLAETQEGYRNLLLLSSYANIDGKNQGRENAFCVPIDFLRTHAAGLICLTSCLKGELSSLLSEQRYDDALRYLDTLKEIFSEKNVFIELIDNNLPAQKILLPQLIALAKETKTPVVATADVHYLHAKDQGTHLSLMSIKHKWREQDLEQIDKSYEFHLLSQEEFLAKWSHIPEALDNTIAIASRCQFKIDTKSIFMPDFRIHADEPANDCLIRLAREGLAARRGQIALARGPEFSEDLWKKYEERLEYEISVITKMNFSGYFLIVQDFINWAKERQIPVGPGRGSAAGSLVTYALRITNIDPIRFNLLFERFLNPERVSMPDIDTDFCQDRRDEVIQYVYERYGQSNVSQIVTFGRLMARNAIKGLARIKGWSFTESNEFAKLIPETPGTTLDKALESEELLKNRLEQDQRAGDLFEEAREVEGVLNSLGIHAAGVIISDKNLRERCPMMESEGQMLTQIEYKYAEKAGLIKFDFLGLKTLTVIDKAIQNIKKTTGNTIDIETLDVNDPKVYELISSAHVTGLFQLESSGMRKLIADLKPTSFSDIESVLALFRPGPLGSGMVEDFVLRKHGKKALEYPLPELEPILKDTYGVMVFQEQIQKIAAVLGQYSLGEADLLRRAMGKKDKAEMARQKTRFLEGAAKAGFDVTICSDIFELMQKFADYGFNKSHTAAYGWVTYQTAYLKTYYTAEFMAAIMSCDLDNTDKIVSYVRDCRRMKITLLPPSINHAAYEFTIPQPNHIQFGLGAVKGLGQGIIDLIVSERTKNGLFRSVPEFIARVDPRKLNKKTMETLIKCGAFDAIEPNRAQLIHNMDAWLKTIGRERERQDQVGDGIFGLGIKEASATASQGALASLLMGIKTQQAPRWPFVQELEYEAATLGFFMSGHPTDLFKKDFESLVDAPLCDCPLLSEPGEIPEFKRKSSRIGGMIAAIFDKRTKAGDRFCIIKLEDATGELEIAVFPKQFQALSPEGRFAYKVGDMVWIECKLQPGFETGSVRGVCQSLGYVWERRVERARLVVLRGEPPFLLEAKQVKNLVGLLNSHKGSTPVVFRTEIKETKMKVEAQLVDHGIHPTDAFIYAVEKEWSRLLAVECLYRPQTPFGSDDDRRA